MVVALIGVEAVHGGERGVEVVKGIPVDAGHGHAKHIHQGLELPVFIMPPGGEAGFGDPDFGLRAGALDLLADLLQVSFPALPGVFEGVGKAVKADDVNVLHDAALEHQAQPVGIHRAEAAEHGAPSPAARPVGGPAEHVAEGEPLAIQGPVPFPEVVGLVPELDVLEMLAEEGEHKVYEVGIILGHARRRGGFGGHP